MPPGGSAAACNASVAPGVSVVNVAWNQQFAPQQTPPRSVDRPDVPASSAPPLAQTPQHSAPQQRASATPDADRAATAFNDTLQPAAARHGADRASSSAAGGSGSGGRRPPCPPARDGGSVSPLGSGAVAAGGYGWCSAAGIVSALQQGAAWALRREAAAAVSMQALRSVKTKASAAAQQACNSLRQRQLAQRQQLSNTLRVTAEGEPGAPAVAPARPADLAPVLSASATHVGPALSEGLQPASSMQAAVGALQPPNAGSPLTPGRRARPEAHSNDLAAPVRAHVIQTMQSALALLATLPPPPAAGAALQAAEQRLADAVASYTRALKVANAAPAAHAADPSTSRQAPAGAPTAAASGPGAAGATGSPQAASYGAIGAAAYCPSPAAMPVGGVTAAAPSLAAHSPAATCSAAPQAVAPGAGGVDPQPAGVAAPQALPPPTLAEQEELRAEYDRVYREVCSTYKMPSSKFLVFIYV